MKNKKVATKFLRYLWILFPFSLIVWFTSIRKNPRQDFSYSLFLGKSGWGYNILFNHDIVIHQENIPTVQTQIGFENRVQAEKAARLVIKKFLFHEAPALNKVEIRDILSEKDSLNK